MAENIEFNLKVKEDNLNKSLDSATKKSIELNDVLTVALGSFAGTVAIKGFELIGKAIGNATDFLFESVNAAAESETAFKKLEVALAQTGQLTDQTVKNFKSLADEIQKTTAFEDDAVISAGALIQTLGRLSGEGLSNATKAAVDLSAALGIDLESAATLVGKAANGNVTAFGKLGIEIQKGSTDAETFANTLQVLNSRFGGSAASQVNTFAGAFEQLKNIYGDLKETIGGLITSNPALIAAFNVFKNILVQVGESIKNSFGSDNQKQVGDLFRGIIDGVAVVVTAFDAAFRVIDSTINLILGSVRTLALGIVTPVAAVLELAASIPKVGDAFRGAADAASSEMNRLSDAVNENAAGIQNAFTQRYIS
jgi:phage-related protein